MAELHLIGQILGAEDFGRENLFCRWSVQCGNNWKVIAGKKEGQTQVSTSIFDDICKWNFPLDIHFATQGIQGWPKIYLQIYHLDWVGRSHLFGYGFITIPTAPGVHKLKCFTWRPLGNLRERFVQYFLGGCPQLKSPDLLVSSTDRYKLSTETMGSVSFEFNVVFRNFAKFGIEYK